ncbi:OpgC family protein [Prosthecodimorpha staleyi]|uniref:OpgC domain-containing protein n=1 Tax=Prosthecodimorpha staleyi TaxID=2840188 RepID=A0A947D798_9HYPH|nr:OpgC domain-containing protein [Prosthecodimorpha staleyi]MBT9288134.1 OpgC domain-containing protein [Prosthecodimorpha staleyi]
MSATPAKRVRDPRLDVFRGLTMFIIFVAHVPENGWNDWIPARFGFSSGSELFVFCSGAASAIAFGSIFVRRGWWLGTARILHRMWQVYWAHLGLLFVLAALAAGADRLWPGQDWFEDQFGYFIEAPARAMLGVVTLTWQPDYLDILPMYIVVLALIPVMMGLRRVHPLAPFALSAALYLAVKVLGINLPGDPEADTGWFFNPFAWQLVFFSGFALMSGWVRTPPLGDRRLMAAAILFLIACVPLSFWGFTDNVPALQALREQLIGPDEKQNLAFLRWVHFIVLLYVVLSVIEPYRDRLATGIGAVLVAVGQQSLATFLASLVFARIAWVALDLIGHGALATALVNLAAFAGIVAVARLVAWIKSAPWAAPVRGPAAMAPASVPVPAAPAEPAPTRNNAPTSRVRAV